MDGAARRPRQFETPDLRQKQNYVLHQKIDDFALSALPARRFLKIIDNALSYKFLRSKSYFKVEDEDEDAEVENNNWLPYRSYASGAFGDVGCWVKRDRNGNVIDEVVVKQLKEGKNVPDKWQRWDENDPKHALLTEAVVQKHLNLSGSENLVHLRGYKFFDKHLRIKYKNPATKRHNIAKSDTKTWRFYLEHAPYGSLNELANRYHYWRQYLPEAFLWHTFSSLAEAAWNMRYPGDLRGLPRGTSFDKPGPWDQVVHIDIKPENIFLSYPDHREHGERNTPPNCGGTLKYDYPVVKLGDFGMAFFTSENDPDNPGSVFLSGTPGSKAPEQIHYGGWWQRLQNDTVQNADYSALNHWHNGLHDFEPHNGELQDNALLHYPIRWRCKMVDSVHVWAIAKVIYDTMTLAGAGQYWFYSTRDYHEYWQWNRQQMENFDQVPWEWADNHQSPYSDELTSLVAACMRPMVQDRISLKEMRQRARAGMERWDNKFKEGCEDMPESDVVKRRISHPKLFYRENDILDMPEGKYNLPGTWDWYRIMREPKYDPDWRELRPPFDRRDAPDDNGRLKPKHNAVWSRTRPFASVKKFRRQFKIVKRNNRRELRRRSDLSIEDDSSVSSNFKSGDDDVSDDDDDDDDDDDNDTARAFDKDIGKQGHVVLHLPSGVLRSFASAKATRQGRTSSRSATDDPSDSDFEIARRMFRNGERRSYYRTKPGRKPTKTVASKQRKKPANAFQRAQDRNKNKRAAALARRRSRNIARRRMLAQSQRDGQAHGSDQESSAATEPAPTPAVPQTSGSNSPSGLLRAPDQPALNSIAQAALHLMTNDPNTGTNTANPPQANKAPAPQPPVQPAPRYLAIQAAVAAGTIPTPIPANVDPTDTSFYWFWHRGQNRGPGILAGRYIRATPGRHGAWQYWHVGQGWQDQRVWPTNEGTIARGVAGSPLVLRGG